MGAFAMVNDPNKVQFIRYNTYASVFAVFLFYQLTDLEMQGKFIGNKVI